MEELFYYYGIDNANKKRHCRVYAYDHDEALSKVASELKTCNVRVWKKESLGKRIDYNDLPGEIKDHVRNRGYIVNQVE